MQCCENRSLFSVSYSSYFADVLIDFHGKEAIEFTATAIVFK